MVHPLRMNEEVLGGGYRFRLMSWEGTLPCESLEPGLHHMKCECRSQKKGGVTDRLPSKVAIHAELGELRADPGSIVRGEEEGGLEVERIHSRLTKFMVSSQSYGELGSRKELRGGSMCDPFFGRNLEPFGVPGGRQHSKGGTRAEPASCLSSSSAKRQA